jgi:hypothetical protein
VWWLIPLVKLRREIHNPRLNLAKKSETETLSIKKLNQKRAGGVAHMYSAYLERVRP